VPVGDAGGDRLGCVREHLVEFVAADLRGERILGRAGTRVQVRLGLQFGILVSWSSDCRSRRFAPGPLSRDPRLPVGSTQAPVSAMAPTCLARSLTSGASYPTRWPGRRCCSCVAIPPTQPLRLRGAGQVQRPWRLTKDPAGQAFTGLLGPESRYLLIFRGGHRARRDQHMSRCDRSRRRPCQRRNRPHARTHQPRGDHARTCRTAPCSSPPTSP